MRVLVLAILLTACPRRPRVSEGPRLTAAVLTTCLRDGGRVTCWGPPSFHRKVEIEDGVRVAAGMFETCAIRRDGSVVCWSDMPRWDAGVSDAIDVAVGWGQACAVTRAGKIVCWDAVTMDRHDPPKEVPGIDHATAVAVGMIHACALDQDGRVACWGGNDLGNLGDGTTAARTTPARVAGLTNIVEIAAGTYYSCARRRDGEVWCWGGFTSAGESPRPVRVPEWSGAVQLSLNAGCNAGRLLCARMRDGTVRCFGDNDAGQVGDGTTVSRDAPVVVRGLADAAEVAVGCSHVCALRKGGQLVCWGDGETLGFPRGDDQRVPVPITISASARSP